MDELFQHHVFQTLKRVLAFTEDVRERPFAGKPLVLLAQAKLGAHEVDQVLGVASVQDREPRLQPDWSPVATQQNVRNRVKGSAADALAPCPDQEPRALQ